MKTRTASAVAVVALLALAVVTRASDTLRPSKRSTVETFRNNHANPARQGRPLVGSFTRSTSSIIGGPGRTPVKTTRRTDGPGAGHGKSVVVTVRSRGGNFESNVVSVEGEPERGPTRD